MEQTAKWSGFEYTQVRGLADRIVSRYLRTQRKNMRRFFASHGMLDLLERMEQIKRSRQGMLAKNQMFQKVMNNYVATLQPQAAPVDAPVEAVGVSRAEAVPGRHSGEVAGVQRADGVGLDPSGSVRELALENVRCSEAVIEE